MKKEFILSILGIFFSACLIAQDGSNIRYFEPNQLNSSMIGKYCHIDFGNPSFGGVAIDTIEINVKGQAIKFYEHRVDNGYNNWFRQQYLESVDKSPMIIRLQNSKIDSLTKDRIYVTSILSYYINESPIDTITVFQHWYDLKDVSKVLIRD